MDALIAQLRDGSVTLRRNKNRRTKTNAALQEMFAVLEQNRNQNRCSMKLVDTNFGLVDIDIDKPPAAPPTPTGSKKRIAFTANGEEEDTIFV